MDNNTLNNSAAKNPLTTNPPTNLPANNMIIAFITKRNNPKVTIVAGSVKNINNGRTNIFSSEITAATITAVT